MFQIVDDTSYHEGAERIYSANLAKLQKLIKSNWEIYRLYEYEVQIIHIEDPNHENITEYVCPCDDENDNFTKIKWPKIDKVKFSNLTCSITKNFALNFSFCEDCYYILKQKPNTECKFCSKNSTYVYGKK